jgi:hypothetical protein
MTEPTVQRIIGQLGYLFDDEPALRDASAEELAARLDHDDRMARARSEEPLASRHKIEARAAALEPHVTVDLVRAALDQMN